MGWIREWLREQEDDSLSRRLMKNILAGSSELLVCVLLLCLLAPGWERKGFFPGFADGVINVLAVLLVFAGIIHAIQCMVRALQLFNEYRYEKKYGNTESLDE